MAPDQEWCLNCGAAADTEVVEARGWRVPIYLGGALAALAIIGVVLAIIALSSGKEEVAQQPNATPTPSAVGTPAVPTTPPATSPAPLETVTPNPSPESEITPEPTPTDTIEPEPTDDPFDDGGSGNAPSSTFPGWSGTDGYTVIIESNETLEGAETVAQEAQDSGHTVGILNSDDYSSLNGGYYVVFSGEYTSEDDAEASLDSLKSDYADAYVRRVAE
jgi:hypothetical protein